MKVATLSKALGAVMLLAVACAPSAAEERSERDPAVRPDETELVKSEVSPGGFQAILGTGDLAVGLNRVGFVLVSSKGFVTEPTVEVTSRFYAGSGPQGEAVQTTEAVLKSWPYGNRGLHVAELSFDRAGEWGLDIAVNGVGGAAASVRLLFDVADSTSAPAVGDPAVRSASKTLFDVGGAIEELTTGSLQDGELYKWSIADAVSSGMPTVIVFASPAFCSNEVCGPQIDVLQQIKNTYRDKGHFIHVDFYDNPHEIQGDLANSRLSPSVLEWGLPSIEWTFVVDRSGVVSARFEGFATYEEVEEALLRLL